MRILVLLNARAGTLNTGAVERPAETVAEAFREAGHEADIHLVAPDEMDLRLQEAAGSDWDVIVVGGGDGTFSHALARLAGSGKALGLLPLGTMNLAGRDMYEKLGDFPAMARALARGSIVNIDLATLNGRPFHTFVGLGYFARVAREREQSRYGVPGGRALSVLVSIWKSVTRTGRTRLDISAGGRTLRTRAYATMITNNRIGEDWRRTQLDEGILELHIMRAGHFAGRAKAGMELLSGRWREGDTIETIAADKVEIDTARPRLWLAVDGELRREETPLVIRIERGKVPVLMPAKM